jgi:hypothetical protein
MFSDAYALLRILHIFQVQIILEEQMRGVKGRYQEAVSEGNQDEEEGWWATSSNAAWRHSGG